MKLTKLLPAALLVFGVSTAKLCAEENAGNDEMILFMDIPTVITASKKEESVSKAPSVVTVWTAEDIQKMGLRTLKEVFDRTVGFFTSRQYATPVIGSHGLISDGNEPFLFLIDGHSINSIAMHGAACYFLLPALDKVKRIEIIRGPGSTLWGSDAALATINIITKDGSDINGLQVNMDASSNDGQRTTNILYGKEYGENNSLMFSYTLTKEDGFPYGTGAMTHRGAYDNASANIERVAPLDEMPDSFEFHVKAKMDDVTMSAHASDVFYTDLWRRNTDPNAQYFGRRRTTYIEITHSADISDSVSLKTNVFTNFLQSDDHMWNLMSASAIGSVQEEKCAKEQNTGIDLMLNKTFNNGNDLKFGIRSVMTYLDPIFTYTNLTQLTGNVQLNAAPNDYDKEFAAFLEDTWKAAENLDIIVGVRADNDNLLENKTAYMPRFAGIYSLDKNSTFKYMFNSGYVRPSAASSDLGQQPQKIYPLSELNASLTGTMLYRELAAGKAEQIQTHDIQYLFNNETTNGSVDFYQTTLKDFFNYSGAWATSDGTALGIPSMVSADGLPYRLAEVNANTIVTTGMEIEAKKKLTKKIDIYGNVSYIFSSKVDDFVWKIGNYTTTLQGQGLYTNNKDACSFPTISWNIGTDIVIKKNITVNLQDRGFSDTWTLDKIGATATTSTYIKLPLADFIDINVRFSDLLADKSLNLNIFFRNVLNNEAKIGLVGGGYWISEGISMGAKLSYKFSGI